MDLNTSSSQGSTKPSPWVIVGIIVLIVGATTLHYASGHDVQRPHLVARRLYYLPIVLAAFAYGMRGGLLTAILVTLLWIPHAFLMMHGDPTPTIDKLFEIVLYLVMGLLTGTLVDRQRASSRRLSQSLKTLQETKDRLVEREKLAALGEISAGLAHELRTPLASIRGSVETMADEAIDPESRTELGGLLVRETERLNNIVTEFLQFARPPIPRPRELALRPWLEDQQILLRAGLSADMALEAQIEGDPRAYADPELLAAVLHNLVRNSAQAIAADEGSGVIRVQIQQFPTKSVLTVSDDGPGIPAELAPRVFDPFVSERSGGSGLGLAVSRRIVESHGGTISVVAGSDKRGVGICVQLPAASKEMAR